MRLHANFTLPDQFSIEDRWVRSIDRIYQKMEEAFNLYKNRKMIENNPIECPEGIIYERGAKINDSEIAVIAFDAKFNRYNICIFNIIDKNLKSYHKAEKINLKKPNLIAINKKNEIIITDDETEFLHIFNKDFISEDHYRLKVGNYNDMAIDEDTNDIYLVKCVGKADIKVIDYKTKQIKAIKWRDIKELQTEEFKPRFIKVLNNQIFIVNACCIEIEPQTREFFKKFGQSFIYVLDKMTFEIINFIDLNEIGYCQPWNLFVDAHSNIYTTVFQIVDNKYISNKRCLSKFSCSGDHTVNTPLQNELLSNDVLFFNFNFLILTDNKINFYAF